MNEVQNIITADNPALQIASVSGCYSFSIRNTKQSSSWFGNCEICNKPASEIWNAKKMKSIFHPILQKPGEIEIWSRYGHKDCLDNLIDKQSKSAEEAL
ncbi:MAG: hypothetical protein QM751_13000 [Paludibacteraceae bacterium]